MPADMASQSALDACGVGLRCPALPTPTADPPTQPTHPLPALCPPPAADPSHIHDFMPSSQDLVFDCIRVTWVAMVSSGQGAAMLEVARDGAGVQAAGGGWRSTAAAGLGGHPGSRACIEQQEHPC